MDNTLYTENSIESLDPLQFTRLRPQIYCGNVTYATQPLIEGIANAVDEWSIGHTSEIHITLDKDNVIRLEDDGQGFLVNSFREDGKTVLEASFSVINTSGKYRNDGVYEGTSLGSFGIGGKLINFLSHWMCAQTFRDGEGEEVWFREGVFESRKTFKTDSNRHGTILLWQPSEEFFTYPQVEIDRVTSLLQTITCLCPGLKITLDDHGNTSVFLNKNGLHDLADATIKDKEIIKNRFSMNYCEGKNKMDFILTYTSNYSSTIVPYVNIGLTERGPHITQVKTTITREFNKFFKDKKWLKDKDDGLTGEDIQEGMYIVFNLVAPNISYDSQVKSTVTKIDMAPFTAALAQSLQTWLAANEKEIKTIADKAISARKAREAAKKARDNIRNNSLKGKKKKFLNLPTKLVDANAKNRLSCELFIVEGDSAAGGLVKGRNSETQAIFPIRGKLINSFKQTSEKVFNNQEVANIIKALGLDVDKDGKLIYDKTKLRYGKIIMATDAE